MLDNEALNPESESQENDEANALKDAADSQDETGSHQDIPEGLEVDMDDLPPLTVHVEGNNSTGIKVDYKSETIFDGDATDVLLFLAKATQDNARANSDNSKAIMEIAKLFVQTAGTNISGLTINTRGEGTTGVYIKGN